MQHLRLSPGDGVWCEPARQAGQLPDCEIPRDGAYFVQDQLLQGLQRQSLMTSISCRVVLDVFL